MKFFIILALLLAVPFSVTVGADNVTKPIVTTPAVEATKPALETEQPALDHDENDNEESTDEDDEISFGDDEE